MIAISAAPSIVNMCGKYAGVCDALRELSGSRPLPAAWLATRTTPAGRTERGTREKREPRLPNGVLVAARLVQGHIVRIVSLREHKSSHCLLQLK